MIRRFVDIELGSGLLCPGVSQTNHLQKDAIGRAPVRPFKLIEFESDHWLSNKVTVFSVGSGQ